MGKLIMMFSLIALGTLSISVETVQAQKCGFYVAPKVGYSSGDISGDHGSSWIDANSAGIGVAVGYDFNQNHDVPIRLDLEYFHRFDDTSSDNNAGATKSEADFGWQTVMANIYYDFHNSSKFTPFINAGMGIAYLSIDSKSHNSGHTSSESDSLTEFAWSGGAGVSYAITDSLAMDVSYRYIDVNVGGEDSGSLNSHEAIVGARFTF